MARKSLTVTIDAPGRDFGKMFVITEMSAVQAEKWAIRALMALSHGDLDVPDSVVGSGMAGVVKFGLSSIASMKFADAEPLLDEMMKCVTVQPGPDARITTPMYDGATEEITTILLLRAEVFKLHTDFFRDAAFSTWASGLMSRFRGSSSMPTSAQESVH